MRWARIVWKPSATWEDRVACMSFALGVNDPPMPSEFFINDVWVNELPQPPATGETE